MSFEMTEEQRMAVDGLRRYLDEVIEPAQTRARLIAGLRLLETKRDTNPPRKHGNIPL